jgi:hypothetical protein
VLLIRPEGTAYDDPQWAQQRRELATAVESWSGNPTQVVDLDVAEFAAAARGGDPIVGELRQEVRILFGDDLARHAESSSGTAP